MEYPNPLIVRPADGGLNQEKDQTELQAGESHNNENMYPTENGLTKRMGLSKAIATDIGGHIYHLKRFQFYGPPGDNMYALWADDATFDGHIAVMGINGTTLLGQVFADIGLVDPANPGDGARYRELVPASTDMIHITTTRTQPHRKLQYSGGSYVLSDNTAAHMQDKLTALWWREHLLLLHDAGLTGGDMHEMVWSEYNNPQSFPVAKTVIIRPYGVQHGVNGLAAAGDVIYIIKPNAIWGMTGAVEEYWRLELLKNGVGGFSSLSATESRGVVIGLAHEPTVGADGTYVERAFPTDIYALSGFNAEMIGGRVKTLIESLYPITDNFPVTLRNKTRRAVTWSQEELVVLFPRIPLEAAVASTAIAMHHSPRGSTFWKWTFNSTVTPNAPEYYSRRCFVGCGDGHIRYFNPAQVNDDGTAFDALWDSRALYQPNRGRKWSVNGLTLEGGQTSGSPVEIYIASGEDAFPATPNRTVNLNGGKREFVRTNGIRRAYYHKVRLKCPADGRETTFRELGVWVKPLGRK